MWTITPENLYEWMIRIIGTAKAIHFHVWQRIHVVSEHLSVKNIQKITIITIYVVSCTLYIIGLYVLAWLPPSVANFWKVSHITLHLHHFAWCQAVPQLPLFQFPMNPCVLVQHNAVNTKFLLTIFKGPGNGFLWLTHGSHLINKLSTACQSSVGDTADTIFWTLSFRLSSVQGLLLHTISFNMHHT